MKLDVKHANKILTTDPDYFLAKSWLNDLSEATESVHGFAGE